MYIFMYACTCSCPYTSEHNYMNCGDTEADSVITLMNWGMVAWEGLLIIRNLIFLCSTSEGAPGKLRRVPLAVISPENDSRTFKYSQKSTHKFWSCRSETVHEVPVVDSDEWAQYINQ
jgi:hypothetical protein